MHFTYSCYLALCISFSPSLSLSLFFEHPCCTVLYYRSPRSPLAVFPCFVTTGCSLCIFSRRTILSFSFSLLHFCFGLPRSLLASLADQHSIPHHTIPPANSRPTPASTVPLSPPSCCLLGHTPFASAVFFFFCLFFFCPATLNSIQVLQPPLCALSTSAIFSILFIQLHYLI